MSEWLLQAASAGAALAVLVVLWLLMPLWPGFVSLLGGARDYERRARSRAGPGAALRALLVLSLFFEPLASRLPARWRLRVGLELERAGLAEAAPVTQWLGLPMVLAALAVPAATLLAATLAVSVWKLALLALAAAVCLPALQVQARARARRLDVQRDLPAYLEMITLGLEAGVAFPTALQLAMLRAPAGPLREEFARVLQELRAGHARREALLRLDLRLGLASLSATVAAIVQAEATGVSLAPVLRAQAHRGTQERFARAEKRAMEAPVKMLGPLIICIFPCTFIVVGFPIAAMLFWGA
jgi:tight adherence protein C